MSARLPFTQAAIRPRPTRDEIELARLQLSKITNGDGGKHTLDLSGYSQEDITALFRKEPVASPHSIRAGFIYIAGFAHFVKIGWTTDVSCRVYSIEQGLPEPLKLHHSFAGTQKDERALHKRFRTYRTRGEWFKNEGDLATWIAGGCPK